ncbi:hypothetical protein LUZ60_008961 [Juncus effusus]|nr:hypothetical protein LUZ60_008961 [Juncus effusus]
MMMEELDKSTYTVDESLTKSGFGKFQIFVLFYAGMGWIGEAMEMMLLSFVGPAVQAQWDLSAREESLITSVVFLGMLIGAYSWGIVSDTYGRRQGFLFTAIVTSFSGLLSAFAPNYYALISVRFVVGVGLGGGPVLWSWFLEFVPAPNRGTWMVVFSTFWTLGTILEASLAWLIMPRLGWRWLLALSSLPSFILLLFYNHTPESPRYLCMKGRTEAATQILQKIATQNNTTLPAGTLISDSHIQLSENPQIQSLEIQDSDSGDLEIPDSQSGDLETLQLVNPEGKESTKSESGGVITLLTPKLIRSTFLLWMVFLGNAFAYYGIVLLTSELNNGNKNCEAKKEVNSEHLMNDDGLYKNVFISSFAEIPGLIISALIVDKMGRKMSMSLMLFISCIFLAPLIFSESEIITDISLFGARICISASFTIVYIYAPEIYPTSVRATGIGVASSVGRIGGIICPLVAVALVHGCHQTIAILLFELVIFLSGLAVCFFPFETSGCKLNDSVTDI